MNDVIDWKKEYFKLKENNKDIPAISLKLDYFPKKFYKYRSLNDYTRDSLVDSSVYLESAYNQNDPYDAYYSINFTEVARDQYKNPDFLAVFKSETKIDMSQACLTIRHN